MKSSAQKQTKDSEIKIYNSNENQSFSFDLIHDEGTDEVTHVYAPLGTDAADAILREYDNLRDVEVQQNGNETDISNDSTEADDYLFESLCIDYLGLQGDKPEDWQEIILYNERQASLKKLLSAKAIPAKKKKSKARSWESKRKGLQSNTVNLKSRFGDDIVETKAIFPAKTPSHISKYNTIRNRLSLTEKDLDDAAIKIPAQMGAKADLFDEINPKVEGYEGKPPLHHKALLITEHFEGVIKDAEKKPKNSEK